MHDTPYPYRTLFLHRVVAGTMMVI
jgi:hypothetical protein